MADQDPFKNIKIWLTSLGIGIPALIGLSAVLLGISFAQLSRRMDDVCDSVKGLRGDVTKNTAATANLNGYVDKSLHKRDFRILRIENMLGLKGPLTESSPVALTDLGKAMLHDSGMNALLAKYRSKLTEIFYAENLPASPSELDVEKVARKVVDNYPDFKKVDTKSIDDYMFDHIEGKIFDIWELAGIRFRDMMLEELGMTIPTEKQNKASNPSQL